MKNIYQGVFCAVMLSFSLSCSNRSHDSLKDSDDSNISGTISIANSPSPTENGSNIPLFKASKCELNENSSIFHGTFSSQNDQYFIDMKVKNFGSDEQVNCKQASSNTGENNDDPLKFTGCYISVQIGSNNAFSQYDMHRIDQELPGYKYGGVCSLIAYYDGQTKKFQGKAIKCSKMARTYINGKSANPINNEKYIDFEGNNFGCNVSLID